MMKRIGIAITALLALSSPASLLATKPMPFLVEVVVVFKKDIPVKDSAKIMDQFNHPHKTGMDSSRGKAYFYKTGPKYIMHIEKEKSAQFIKKCATISTLHECYYPDWKIQKD